MANSQFDIPKVPFIAFIHTIQIGCRYEFIPEDEANAKPYISRSVKYSGGKVHYVINPNHFNPESDYITNIKKYEQVFSAIIEDLGLSEQIVFLERADITIDIDESYDQYYKLNCFLTRLYALSISEKNSYRVIGDNLKRRSTVVNNRNCSLEIYNKKDESGKPDVPEIRIEFRKKRVRQSASIHDIVNEVSSLLLNLPKIIPLLNSVQTETLIKAYTRESQCTVFFSKSKSEKRSPSASPRLNPNVAPATFPSQ